MKKILANRVYADSTLKKWSKEDLIELIRILEHNWASAEEKFNNSVKNSDKIFAEQKAEIERLKATGLLKENEQLKKDIQRKELLRQKAVLYAEEKQAQNAELQKQVDELKELNAKYLDSIESVQAGRCRFRCELTQQAVKDTAKEILDEYSKMLIEDFTKSADIQDFVTVKQTLKNVCPAKVTKIKKKMTKRYGLGVEK